MRIKNWKKFQHFKDRRPPWIKLYRDILDDKEWFRLSGDAKGLLVSLWLIASESDGDLPDTDTLAFRLRTTEEKLKPLIHSLSHWMEQGDINMISDQHQLGSPETERETEKERETEIAVPKIGTAAPASPKSKRPTAYWTLLVDHIKRKWEYKKRPHGKFAPTGQDFKFLQAKAGIYTAFDLMALYDEFMNTDDPFWSKQGHSITMFCKAIDALLDKPGWKQKSERYRSEHCKPHTPEEIENAVKLNSIFSEVIKPENMIGSIRKQELKKEGLLA